MAPSLKTGPTPSRENGVIIVVTGSRKWQHLGVVNRALLDAASACSPIGATPRSHPFRNMILHHGDAIGLDKLAAKQGKAFGMQVIPHAADWKNCSGDNCVPGHRLIRPDGTSYCPTAGHLRNQLMVNLKPTIVLAFPIGGAQGSRGTFDCATRAQRADLPVFWYELPGENI